MNKGAYRKLLSGIGFGTLVALLSSCGNSDDSGPSIEDIPRYPNAAIGETLQQSTPGGLMGGKLEQFTTTDSFADVVAFYTEALSDFDPEFTSFESNLGKQTAISIPREKGSLTVAIQAFEEGDMVGITFMSVGIR